MADQKLREAAQQALEALERYQVKRQDFDRFADEVTALRVALVQPAASGEPLFLLHCGQIDSDGEQDEWDCEADSYMRVKEFAQQHPGQTIKLYAAPQPAAVPAASGEPATVSDLLRRSRNLLSHPPLWWQENEASRERLIGQLDAALHAVVSEEPNMRHPKIQALISSNARRNIELQLVEQLLDDPDCELTSMDMEYWYGLHDKLRDRLLAAAQK